MSYNNSNNNQQYPNMSQQNNDDSYYNDYGFPIQQQPMQQAFPKPIMVVVPQTSGFAVASLVLGILSLLGASLCGSFLVGILCGHVALIKISSSNGMIRGRGLAIAGLILNYLPVVAIVVMMLFSLLLRGVLTR